jgi:hypothetical protein
MYQDELREVQTVTDPLRKAGNTGEGRPEDRIQNRVDEQAKRHFRRAASIIDQLLRYQHEQDQRLVAHVLELAAAGGLAAVGPEDCLWAGSISAIDTLLVRDGATLVGVVCDESRWLAVSGDICPVCGKPTRCAPDVLDELAAAVIETGGSARQIAADLMPDQYPTAAQLRYPPPPREAGPREAGDSRP